MYGLRAALREHTLGQRFIEPLVAEGAQSREKGHVRTARDDVDGVDLQQAHARNRSGDIRLARLARGAFQEALRAEVEELCGALREADHAVRRWGVGYA